MEVALGRLNIKKNDCIWEVTLLPQDKFISHLVILQKYFTCFTANF